MVLLERACACLMFQGARRMTTKHNGTRPRNGGNNFIAPSRAVTGVNG